MSFTKFKKDYTQRSQVKLYRRYWEEFMKKNGKQETLRYLKKGWTNRLTAKDRKGLIQALGLEDL